MLPSMSSGFGTSSESAGHCGVRCKWPRQPEHLSRYLTGLQLQIPYYQLVQGAKEPSTVMAHTPAPELRGRDGQFDVFQCAEYPHG